MARDEIVEARRRPAQDPSMSLVVSAKAPLATAVKKSTSWCASQGGMPPSNIDFSAAAPGTAMYCTGLPMARPIFDSTWLKDRLVLLVFGQRGRRGERQIQRMHIRSIESATHFCRTGATEWLIRPTWRQHAIESGIWQLRDDHPVAPDSIDCRYCTTAFVFPSVTSSSAVR